MCSVVKSCCLLKGNKDETYGVWLWPNNAWMRMKNISIFIQWILCIGGREKVFQGERKFSRLTLNYNTISFKMWMQQITHQQQFSIVSFFNNFNNWFSMFLKTKNIFWKKNACSHFKKDPHHDSESTGNQKTNEQAIIKTQSTLSMKTKIKRKPI